MRKYFAKIFVSMLIITMMIPSFTININSCNQDASIDILHKTFMQTENNDLYQNDVNQVNLSWVTRHMETEWEKVDSNGIADPKHNSTKGDMVNEKYQEQSEYPTIDFNNTVANGTSFILRQLKPEEIVTRSDEGGYDAPATPLTPAKEGHWFPKLSYSRLYFDFIADSWWGVSYKIHLEIERDQDSYSRYLRIKLDGTTFHEVIIGSSGFHGDIWTPVIWYGGEHKITLEIYYGGYKEKGWKLKFFWVYNSDGIPLDVTGEYTHQSYHCNLLYQVKLGDNSILHIKTEDADDSGFRYCYVYIDGVRKLRGYAPGEYEVDIGDYSDDSIHEMRVDIWSSSQTECGKKITILLVHHSGGFVDVDYMENNEPSESELAYIESYYITHGYHRIDLQKDDPIPHSEWFLMGELADDPGGFWEYYDTYSNHKNDPQWEWMIWVYKVKDENGPVDWVGVHVGGGEPDGCCGIVIHDYLLFLGAYNHYFESWSAARKSCSMHEIGHHYHIIDVDAQGHEVYCSNPQCCMALASMVWAMEEPWYCAHHWSQRFFPGW